MSTNQPSESSSQRAARNRYSQAETNKSLANYLAGHNLPVPSSLKRSPQASTYPSRSNKRHHVPVEDDANAAASLVCPISITVRDDLDLICN